MRCEEMEPPVSSSSTVYCSGSPDMRRFSAVSASRAAWSISGAMSVRFEGATRAKASRYAATMASTPLHAGFASSPFSANCWLDTLRSRVTIGRVSASAAAGAADASTPAGQYAAEAIAGDLAVGVVCA